MSAGEPHWFDDPENVLDLAQWLHEEVNEFYDPMPGIAVQNVLYYFEKPWKWEDAWVDYQKGRELGG